MNTMPEKETWRRFIVAAGVVAGHTIPFVLLQRFNYEVFIANTAAQAFERISADRPALVFTDLALPDMGGMDFFMKLRESRDGKSIPVIFMVPPGDAGTEHVVWLTVQRAVSQSRYRPKSCTGRSSMSSTKTARQHAHRHPYAGIG